MRKNISISIIFFFLCACANSNAQKQTEPFDPVKTMVQCNIIFGILAEQYSTSDPAKSADYRHSYDMTFYGAASSVNNTTNGSMPGISDSEAQKIVNDLKIKETPNIKSLLAQNKASALQDTCISLGRAWGGQ